MSATADSIDIVLVTAYYPAHGGGIERVAMELARTWTREDALRVWWMASDCDPVPEPLGGLAAQPARSWNGIERRLSLPWPVWSPASLVGLWRAIGRSSVVHVHDHFYFGSMAAVVMARLRGRPLVLTQHVGVIPYRSGLLRAILWLVNHVSGRWMLARAHRVAFVSQAVRDYFAGFVPFRQPPTLIANGLDQALFAPASAQRRDSLRAPLLQGGRRHLCLFVGRYVEKKGLPIIHELARAMPDVQWVLLGEGPLDPRAWNLPNVTPLPAVPQARLVPYYQAADLLVLPSKGEGFPLVVQEAMACGTPAVVGLDSAAALPLAPGLLQGEDTESPAAAGRWIARLRPLLADGDGLLQWRERVAMHAREQWSWSGCARQYLELFRSAGARLSEGGGPR